MAQTIVQVEPGFYRRRNPKTGELGKNLWYTTTREGQTVFVSAKTPKLSEARKVRALAVAATEQGLPVTRARLLVNDILDGVLRYHEKNHHASLGTERAKVAALRAVLGPMPVKDLRTKHIEAMQVAWQKLDGKAAIGDVTINRRCETLRLALNLAAKAGDIARAVHVPMIKKPKSIRGKYIPGAAQAVFSEYLPDYVVTLLDFARLFGTRKGQLSRTERTWIDRTHRVLTWPPDECKNDEPHEIVLDERAWVIIERLLADGEQRPWCPYLFHGRYCHPGRKRSKKYGCVGDFKKAWAKAMVQAGLPVGRKAGGYTFHNSRNTFATDFIAGGGTYEDAQILGGWKTQHMVKHYNLRNREALRERLERARVEGERLAELDAERRNAARPLHSIATGGRSA